MLRFGSNEWHAAQSVEDALASDGITFGSNCSRSNQRNKNRKCDYLRAVHDFSPVVTKMGVQARKQGSRVAPST
jgi:hypothetical protein